MAEPAIAAVIGGETAGVQALFARLAAQVGPRAVGVVEENPEAATRGRNGAMIRSLTNERRYAIFQELGASSAACQLVATGVVEACADIERAIAAGCDLVILSKFGKLESERTGLMPAFAAALAAQVPILTSVSPRYEDAWARFAAPLFVALPPDEAAITAWWRAVSARNVL